MNFFEQQDRARRNSSVLVILMILAVTALITMTSLCLVTIWEFAATGPRLNPRGYVLVVGCVALGVISVVLLGSLYKHFQLSDGGKVVAERLGGRLISLQPMGLAERRLLNVVEEMALASGTPVPPVYVLDEPAINAFAAGLTPQDAVIGITRGALHTLDRDELQGVIAHEFSHIFHGDMRLNTRLVSVLHGILLLGLIGHFLLRLVSRREGGGRSRDARGKGVIALTGLTLLIIGYAGSFFGNLIKSAVNRQREYLADASAVQFTRNPLGVAGALKKIGGHLQGSQLAAAHANEFSHMYFSQGILPALGRLMATHPLLPARIRRIEPRWDGRFPPVRIEQAEHSQALPDVTTFWSQQTGVQDWSADSFGSTAGEQAITAIGAPEQAHLLQARGALQRLPDTLREAARHRIDAQALMLGLLLDADQQARAHQLSLLRPQLDLALNAALEQHQSALLELPADLRLPLLELAIPALKQLENEQKLGLRRNLAALVMVDGHVSLMEWSLLRIIECNLSRPRLVEGRHRLIDLARECQVLLSALAHAGHADPLKARAAFASACASLPFPKLQLLDSQTVGLKALEEAVKGLTRLWSLQKPQLLKAMLASLMHDGRIEPTEAELMRAIADCIDCPMPPLLH